MHNVCPLISLKKKLQIVHSDVCCPMPTNFVSGNNYFVPDKFKEYEVRVFNDCGGTLHSDNSGECVKRI